MSVVEKEFEEWNKSHEDALLIFLDHAQSRHKVTFMIAGEHEFILTYPDTYPSPALFTVSSKVKSLSYVSSLFCFLLFSLLFCFVLFCFVF